MDTDEFVTADVPNTMTRFEDARIRGVIAQFLQSGAPLRGVSVTGDAVSDALCADISTFTDVMLCRNMIASSYVCAPARVGLNRGGESGLVGSSGSIGSVGTLGTTGATGTSGTIGAAGATQWRRTRQRTSQ